MPGRADAQAAVHCPATAAGPAAAVAASPPPLLPREELELLRVWVHVLPAAAVADRGGEPGPDHAPELHPEQQSCTYDAEAYNTYANRM